MHFMKNKNCLNFLLDKILKFRKAKPKITQRKCKKKNKLTIVTKNNDKRKESSSYEHDFSNRFTPENISNYRSSVKK